MAGALALTDEDWHTTFNANLYSSVRLDRGFLPYMVKQQGGVIVHISSIQRKLPGNMTMPYSAAKAVLVNYSKNPATQFGPDGIRINALAPGFTETESAERLIERMAEQAGTDYLSARQQLMNELGGIPLGRPNLRRLPNLPPSWHQAEPLQLQAASMSLTAEPSAPFNEIIKELIMWRLICFHKLYKTL